MSPRTMVMFAFAVAIAAPAWCQDTATDKAKADAKPAADTNAPAHEFLKNKVDKTMYSLSEAGVKSALLLTESQTKNPMMGDLTLKTKYVWQSEPPREKFALLEADKLPPQVGMMKAMIEEGLRENSRQRILSVSQQLKDAQLSMAKTEDGNVAITLPEKTQSMGPMTLKRQETHVYTPEGKIVRAETKITSQMMNMTQKSTFTLKEVGGKWLVVGREESSEQGSSKTEITYEEKDGLQLPVESKQVNQAGDQVTKFTLTPNTKLTDADFADAPAAPAGGEKKQG